jgi:hypothetical protein
MPCFKNTILFVLGIVCYSCCSAQSVSELKTLPSNIDRYYVDYEIVGMTNPTAIDVADIDLNQYEDLRLSGASIVVEDVTTGYTLILYSIEQSIKNWYGNTSKTVNRIEK